MANTKKYLIDGQATDPNARFTAYSNELYKAENEPALTALTEAHANRIANPPKAGYDYDYYAGLLKQQADRDKGIVNQNYTNYLNQASAQQTDLAGGYDRLRGQTYSGSRQSAIGNNEALAAQGLSGNLYSSPTSGYSETARIYQDVALRNIIASYNEEEKEALRIMTDAIRQANLQKQQQLAQIETDYDNKMIEEGRIKQAYDEERRAMMGGVLDAINNLDPNNVDTYETTLRQMRDTGQIKEDEYSYLKGEYERKRASTAFVDMDADTAKQLYDELMETPDLTNEEKQHYTEAYERHKETTTPAAAKEGAAPINVATAKESDFGNYYDTGKSGSNQSKYVQSILSAAKAGKIPDGTTIDFNYGLGYRKVFIYSGGAFYPTDLKYADYADTNLRGSDETKAFKTLYPDADY